jgi:hypothetical protein
MLPPLAADRGPATSSITPAAIDRAHTDAHWPDARPDVHCSPGGGARVIPWRFTFSMRRRPASRRTCVRAMPCLAACARAATRCWPLSAARWQRTAALASLSSSCRRRRAPWSLASANASIRPPALAVWASSSWTAMMVRWTSTRSYPFCVYAVFG